MKTRQSILILICTFTLFLLFESKNIWVNGSLILADLNRDISWYRGDTTWVMRYNEAIWLSQNGKYAEAKALITPLLNNTHISKRAEVAELYGDIIYYSSGSIDDTISMYERARSIDPSDRIIYKIASIKQKHNSQTGSWKIEKKPSSSEKIHTWSQEIESKKVELQKIAKERDTSLGNNTLSAQESKNTLERLIESAQSESPIITQDW